ncbi:MAG: carboxylating nicotinate-nucleotide diphosphorylase [Anaerolineae bacterium]|nr:carboxylating nicotinate-nucleotide diphosphorylase [Anaerolineae bacterium]
MAVETIVEHLVRLALNEDLDVAGDVTSIAILPPAQHLYARIVVKQAGVICGLNLVSEVYRQVDPAVKVTPMVNDGDHVMNGKSICEVEGVGRSVLAGERVALNFTQRLSGIASLTAQFVAAVDGMGATILDTRKTTPGWRALEKYAVCMGGGGNHRMGLYDMVLIKDNHIDAAGGITQAIAAARAAAQARGLAIEVEVKDLDELREALACGVDRILLDNMNLAQMRAAVEIAAGRVPLEASGNMTLERVRAVAETGVNFISVGALTHSAPALDLSMRLTTET